MIERTILVMAGGTGGHVYPALAVADYLREQGVRLYWLGTRTGLEARVVPEQGIPLLLVHVSGLRGKSLLRNLLAPVMLMQALIQSVAILWRYRPDAVLGLGGFASGPGGVAAWLLRVPLFIHEQNAIAGLTNRLLAPIARRVMLGFPGALHGARVITTGNPVRAQIRLLESPEIRLASRQAQPLRLLVLGGSLGAAALNKELPAALTALPEHIRVDVWHQTGNSHIEFTRNLYREHDLGGARVEPYIEDMAAAYAWADLVLCRAGASTVAEICAVGVASVLVPYPHAVDDHQTANARYLSDAGAAILLPQERLTTEGIVQILCSLHEDRGQLLQMAITARQKSYPEATVKIANICLEEGVAHV